MTFNSFRIVREFNTSDAHFILCEILANCICPWYVFENTGGHLFAHRFVTWDIALSFLDQKGCVLV